jgi:hypothetical protein
MTTETLLLAEPSTGRITITCNQLFQFPYFVQHHYDFTVYKGISKRLRTDGGKLYSPYINKHDRIWRPGHRWEDKFKLIL